MCWQPLFYLHICWQMLHIYLCVGNAIYSAPMVIREQIAEVSLFFLPLCES